jgi:hypothetical protein
MVSIADFGIYRWWIENWSSVDGEVVGGFSSCKQNFVANAAATSRMIVLIFLSSLFVEDFSVLVAMSASSFGEFI